jgi:hypothetical protein
LLGDLSFGSLPKLYGKLSIVDDDDKEEEEEEEKLSRPHLGATGAHKLSLGWP